MKVNSADSSSIPEIDSRIPALETKNSLLIKSVNIMKLDKNTDGLVILNLLPFKYLFCFIAPFYSD